MQFKDLKELTAFDNKNLGKELRAAEQYLHGIRFENSQGNLKDTSQLNKSKAYIARINTIQKQREGEEALAAA